MVSVTVSAERVGNEIDVLGDIAIVFADWNISNPSVGGFVTTQSLGTLEVLLHLTRSAGNSASTGASEEFEFQWRGARHCAQHDRAPLDRPN